MSVSATIQVILSHEHTDFDALASMLAASLLYPDSIPVLPRQLNRNVASFLALYRNHLPFVTDKELPRGRVARAILVDTRAVNWVKGMDDSVEMVIIDHHSADSDETIRGEIWSEAVGANTTLLVEKLRERQVDLSPVQATLLVLGIHEDTGSLTYASTTHRDARALAWLMEPQHNVNLRVVNDFLNHPLSQAQRTLLQALIDGSEYLDIGGHFVVIAQATATGFQEEISALASRLRDFHETDAVFLLIDLGDIIQVVARSTTDEIDVGKIAAELGGGGHTRAAAAPIAKQRATLQSVRDQIVTLIEQNSHTAVTVRHIMSSGRPQTLSPDMTIDEAAELMRRYGHEGFPVLRQLETGGEELLGVLTRREADRALTHDLGDQKVSRFMRAGKVTVRPDDAVATLRRAMIDTNWGQVPVVDGEGRLIGIVTRTDLIKLWDESSLPQRHAGEIAQKLEATLSPVQHALLRLIGEEVECMNFTVYVVGGFVRDLLLNHDSAQVKALDMDIVIEGNAIDFARRMQELYGGRIVPHKRFNTAKWLLDDPEYPVHRERLMADLDQPAGDADLPPHLDFVTARTEFYTEPTVLPIVEDSSIKLDLHRRDFTINTLALCLNPDRWGELLDFYGGLNDLRQGVVRVLHSLSFVDDPTRILRAVRYEQRFGFRIDARTLELLQDAIELLDRVTPARIRHELERILQEEYPEKAIARLAELEILARLHPELHEDYVADWTDSRFAVLRELRRQMPGSLIAEQPIERLYYGILVYRLPEQAHAALNSRLGLRVETQRLVRGLNRIRVALPDLRRPALPPSRVVAIFDEVDPAALALIPVICAGEQQVLWFYRRYLAEWQNIQPELNGNDLLALGVPRGPIYRQILSTLRAGRLDGSIKSRKDELAYVHDYLARKR